MEVPTHRSSLISKRDLAIKKYSVWRAQWPEIIGTERKDAHIVLRLG